MIRIGGMIGGVFVSIGSAIINTTPLWFTLACSAGAIYLMVYHGTAGGIMLAGYLLFLGVFPVQVLFTTFLAGLAIFGMWLHVKGYV